MKILLINKKTIIPVLFIGCIFLICVITFFFLKSKYPVSQNVIYSVTPSKNQNYDLTGDGSKDSFQLLSNENKLDFNIKSSGEEFYLSKEIDDKIEEIKNEMKDETDEEVYNILDDSKKSKKKK